VSIDTDSLKLLTKPELRAGAAGTHGTRDTQSPGWGETNSRCCGVHRLKTSVKQLELLVYEMSAQQAGSVRASPLTPQRLSPSALLSSRRRLHPSASRAQSSSSNENISPAVVLSVAKEIRKLCTEPLDGIKVQLNEEDVTDIIAEIHGPGAPAGRLAQRCASAPAAPAALLRLPRQPTSPLLICCSRGCPHRRLDAV